MEARVGSLSTMPAAHVPSTRLIEQIGRMVAASEDYIIDADGIDESVHIVVNDFEDGVWLCAHHGECNMAKFTRLQRFR